MIMKPGKLQVKSLSLYIPIESVVKEITQLGFSEVASATVITDAKFWIKRVFKKNQEYISVSDEIGDADYLRDPIVTIYGKQKTVKALRKLE
mgnify:FL=1|jgi:hypothetical protein|tara:strand:- start:899 stop:1174 length:276 start_codon:yes stop_codon:yes gene_type:complete